MVERLFGNPYYMHNQQYFPEHQLALSSTGQTLNQYFQFESDYYPCYQKQYSMEFELAIGTLLKNAGLHSTPNLNIMRSEDLLNVLDRYNQYLKQAHNPLIKYRQVILDGALSKIIVETELDYCLQCVQTKRILRWIDEDLLNGRCSLSCPREQLNKYEQVFVFIQAKTSSKDFSWTQLYKQFYCVSTSNLNKIPILAIVICNGKMSTFQQLQQKLDHFRIREYNPYLFIASGFKDKSPMLTQIDNQLKKIDKVENKVEQLDAKLDAKVAELDTKVAELDTKVDKLDVKVTELDTKVDKLNAKVDAKVGEVDRKVDKLDVKVGELDTKVDKLDAKVDAKVGEVDRKVDKLDAKVSELDAKVDSLKVWANSFAMTFAEEFYQKILPLISPPTQ